MAKRGRPSGVTSWWRNPNNIAAHHAQALMELWLAGAPVVEIRVMLSSLAGRPEYQALIDECWSTIPPKIKRKLCRLAVAHVMELHRDAIQRRHARAAERRLAIQGLLPDQGRKAPSPRTRRRAYDILQSADSSAFPNGAESHIFPGDQLKLKRLFDSRNTAFSKIPGVCHPRHTRLTRRTACWNFFSEI